MSKKNKRSRPAPRAEPAQKRSIALVTQNKWETLECLGYTSLAQNPEICTAVDTIARLIASMTIHLMENTDDGDVRVKNELSRKVDINPNNNMTRSNFIHWIVKTLMLEGSGNAVVWPEYKRGILRDLKPVPPAFTAFVPEGLWNYRVVIAGTEYAPDRILHFVLNPGNYYPWKGDGYHVALADVANNLKQASATEKGFMSSKWKPSIIVKVDSLTDEFSNKEGRAKLLADYIESNEAGEPWLIPADQFSVEQVRPLTLSDLALADFVQLDKRTVAAILGVPPFVLGIGDFQRDAWNNFINSTIMPIAKSIEQEMTKKLLYDPAWFFRFNPWSLYNYSITEMVSAGAEMVDRMALRRNEWRSWVNMPPDPDMNDLLALENYVPADKLGDQNKLNGGENT
ncbi:MAG: phage portal protein [[Clostridium] leptum]